MSNGMSFKAGRDMPPGMQEKMAMKMVAELQQKNGIPSVEQIGRIQMQNKKRLIVDSLKKYHDSQFTPGVYEHSIFGKAALLLEVDAVEVVHGRWVEIDHYPPECSICGDIAPLTCDGEAHYMGNYCPNCGAKMDGGNEDG